MKQEILQVKGLTKKFPTKKAAPYDFFTAVDEVTFTLTKGEVLGILGPNGAGKTTIIQMLLSVLKPTAGSITYFGKDFFSHRSEVLQDISFASSYARLPAQLTVRTNLDIYGQLYGIPAKERAQRIEKYLKLFGMWNLADKETSVLSSGQMTRVMLTKAFLTHPKLVLLDEPTASLDPDIAHDVRTFIEMQQKQQGLSLLITSHNMEEVSQICSRVLVLKHGEIIANNTPENLALSVSQAQVCLTTTMADKLIVWLKSKSMDYTHSHNDVTIKLDEQDIAQFLTQLTHDGITYTQIAIDRPSLHDYFMAIAREPS